MRPVGSVEAFPGRPPVFLLGSWGIDDGGDLDGDGDTDQSDLGILLADWGCGS